MSQKLPPSVGFFFEHSDWFDVKNLPKLAFDHAEMIEKALEIMCQSLDYQLVGFNLMSETFMMKELQRLYETILDEPFMTNSPFQSGDVLQTPNSALAKHFKR